ncbi:type I restriction enzyme subunit R domain-containing protein [Rhizobium sp. RAF56]|uniref:type I restriction enzyme subunit R domain-containing protein n=1 Tax=Rhizobium sp. RAF56 TaxID=3233062 RepID=UPI003F9E3337
MGQFSVIFSRNPGSALSANQHLVAFSGEVDDKESGPDPFTETSKELNPGLNGRDIREAFKLPEYHVLLVANKFQTGFDQPLLCGMYVDRRLAGIQAVQTLSRLNRSYPGKDTTYVLDFVNSSDDILKAFQTYYETAHLANVTDPNLVFDLRAKLDASGYYDSFEVDRVVKVELDPLSKQGDLIAAIWPVVDRLLKSYKAAQECRKIALAKDDAQTTKDAQDEMNALILFRNDMGAFVRLYAFLAQIFDYGNTDIEKRYMFYRRLIPQLEFGCERETVDLSQIKLTHHKLSSKGQRPLALSSSEEATLKPYTAPGSGSLQDKEKALFAQIVERLNDLFQGVDEEDQVRYVMGDIKGQMLKSETLVQQAMNNTKEQFANSPDILTKIMDAVIDASDSHSSLSNQALGSSRVREGIKELLLGHGQLWEGLRQRGEASDHQTG